MTDSTGVCEASTSISEVSASTGLTPDTLRWYEREGLLPRVPRDGAGRRVYDRASLAMIELIVRLRRTGMSVAATKEFCRLLTRGAATHGRRMALLAEHRSHVLDQLAQLQDDLSVVETKIAHYARLIEHGRDCGEEIITDAVMLSEQRRTS